MTDIPGATKHDQDKDPWHLLPREPVQQVVKVLAFGAAKYAPGGWKGVPEWRDRYSSALMRHFVAWRSGDAVDPDSGLPHLAHIAFNAIFLLGKEMGL